MPDSGAIKTLLLDARVDFPWAIERAATLLKSGKLVAFPTETVYGLGADATDPEAVAAVFNAKGRPADNPLIVHIADAERIGEWAVVDDRALLLAEAFMPGPLTLVLPARDSIPAIARGGLPTVAVRIPDHPVALALLELTGPLVAPSANISGRPSPTTARHVIDDLDGRIDAVLDGGPCRVGIESTVLDLSGDRPVVLRPGVIGIGEIMAVLNDGEDEAEMNTGERVGGMPVAETDSPRAPGMKYRHYAPIVPVRLVLGGPVPSSAKANRKNRLVLTTARHIGKFPDERAEILSEFSLYDQFRRAESEGVGEILIYADIGELPEGLLNRVEKAVAEEEKKPVRYDS